MTMNRAQRRAFKHKAQTTAARMAGRCYDFEGPALVHVTDPRAIAALTRAFTISLRFGGKPVALQIGEVEATGFPRWLADHVPGGVTWLAAGLDTEGRASYSLQSAASEDRIQAHETARDQALARLAGVCSTAGFPMGLTRGRA